MQVNTKFKIISPTGLEFNAIIIKTNNKMEIKIGGYKKYCMDITLLNTQHADLPHFEFNSGCYLESNSNIYIDSKELMKAGIYILKLINSSICSITLIDVAYKHGIFISDACIVFDDKGWYEKHFGAKLENNDDKKEYEKLITNLHSVKFKNKNEKKLVDSINYTDNNYNKEILKIVKNTKTFSEFFNELRIIYTPKIVYDIIKDWLHDFMDEIGFDLIHAEKWIISCNDVNTNGFTHKLIL